MFRLIVLSVLVAVVFALPKNPLAQDEPDESIVLPVEDGEKSVDALSRYPRGSFRRRGGYAYYRPYAGYYRPYTYNRPYRPTYNRPYSYNRPNNYYRPSYSGQVYGGYNNYAGYQVPALVHEIISQATVVTGDSDSHSSHPDAHVQILAEVPHHPPPPVPDIPQPIVQPPEVHVPIIH